jgi:IS1 family transposase
MTSEKAPEYGRLEPMLAALEALVRCESPTEDIEACRSVVKLASDIATRVLGVPAQIKEIARGGYVLRDPQSGKIDAVIIATGSEIALALQTAQQLEKEGLGIRSTARVLQISTTTLLKRIITIAKNIPNQSLRRGQIYEVDEMRTFIRNKETLLWIVYALERKTKRVVSFAIGRRTKSTLQNVTDTLLLSKPKRIYTDGLKLYKFLIDENIHKVKRFATNHIERKNLSIRTHLKRLNRKTICFSKNFIILQCILRIYFWS